MENSHKVIQNISDIFDLTTKVMTFDNKPFVRGDSWSWFALFTPPAVPFGLVLLYWFTLKPISKAIRDSFNIQPKGKLLKGFVILHSLILAVYSGWTAVNSIPLVYNTIIEHGSIFGMLCDNNGSLWIGKDFSFWATHFYISKFYEFLDTVIVILQGKEPIFLQTYHHAGIVICMWGLVVSSSASTAVVVCLNSFIHTLMYTYYVFAALGVKSPLKSYLTQAQIIQFIVGVGITIPTHFMPNCLTSFESLSLGVLQLYTFVLIFLFGSFYISSYKKGGDNQKKSRKAE